MNLIWALRGRCGSTAILAALSSSCNVSSIGEPFCNGLYNDKYSVNYTTGNRTFEESYRLLQSKNIDIIKHINWELNDRDNASLRNKCDRIMYLYRTHFVDFYISMHMSTTLRKQKGLEFFNFSTGYLMGNKSSGSGRTNNTDDYMYNQYKAEPRPPIDIEKMKEDFVLYTQTHEDSLKKLSPHTSKVYAYEEIFGEDNIETLFPELVDFFGYEIVNDDWKTMLAKDNKIFQPEFGQLIPNFDEVIALKERLTLE